MSSCDMSFLYFGYVLCLNSYLCFFIKDDDLILRLICISAGTVNKHTHTRTNSLKIMMISKDANVAQHVTKLPTFRVSSA